MKNIKKLNKERKKKVKLRQLVRNLERQGPAGLMHLYNISKVIKRNIRIYNSEGNLEFVIKHNKLKKRSVRVQFHEPGRWSKIDDKNSHDDSFQPNDCLFKAVALQLNKTSQELRDLTVEWMKLNEKEIFRQITDLKELGVEQPFKIMSGAIYKGESKKDAKKYLDNSQKYTYYPNNRNGHPRGHASNPSAKGETESAENYSRSTRKTAFLSRSDQDLVAHLVLISDEAVKAMKNLNNGSTKEVIKLSAQKLHELAEEENYDLPLGAEFVDGKKVDKNKPIHEVVGVLRHFMGSYNNPDEDVFILTLYPVLR